MYKIVVLLIALTLATACTESSNLEGTWIRYTDPLQAGSVSETLEIAADGSYISSSNSTNRGTISFEGTVMIITLTEELSNSEWIKKTPQEKWIATSFFDKSLFSYVEVYSRNSGSGISGSWENSGILYYDDVIYGVISVNLTSTTSNAVKIEATTVSDVTMYQTNYYFVENAGGDNFRMIKTNTSQTNYFTLHGEHLYRNENGYYRSGGDNGSFWLY